MLDPNAWDDEDFPVAMFIQEPYDPSKIPMYSKNKKLNTPEELEPQPTETHEATTQQAATLSFDDPMMKELWSSPAVKRPVISESILVEEQKPTFEIHRDDQVKITGTNGEKLYIQGIKDPDGQSCTKTPIIAKNNQPSLNHLCVEAKENRPLAQRLPAELGSLSSSQKINVDKKNLFQTFIKCGNKEEQDCFSGTENVLKSPYNFDLDVTSYTKSFNLPVTSSTPFINSRKMINSLHREDRRDIVGLGKAYAENVEVHKPAVGVIKELSVIEESSKECVSASSGTNTGASSAECEHPSYRSVTDNTFTLHQNRSQIPSVMTGGSAECKKPQNTRIPCFVSRAHSKEISSDAARHSKDRSVMTGGSAERKKPQNTRILCIVGRAHSKEIADAARHSKDRLPGQNPKEVMEPDDLCKQFEDLVLGDDPFDQNVTNQLLKSVQVPVGEREGFYSISRRIPALKVNSDLQLRQDLGDGGHTLKSLKNVGHGAYAKVYKAASSKWQRPVAIKVQKPPCEWEFYISKEIHERIKDDQLKNCFMDVKEGCFFLDGSILISDFMEYGTLLDVVNMYKMRRSKLPEVLALYFTIDVLKILKCLHSCHIIHGDIKPDNFLLRKVPSMKRNSSDGIEPSLQLIDLGRCIDMSLYPKNASFSIIFQKTFFQCIEMRTKKPWTYQVDFFGVASLIHTLVFGEFINVYCKCGVWNVTEKLPRNMNQSLWNWLFNVLLNIDSCLKLPNITEIIEKLEKFFFSSMINELCPALTMLRSFLHEEKSKRKRPN